jgi:DNA-binding IclR family transcriptional regulator
MSELNYRVRALERALDILEVFTLTSPELSLHEISSRVRLPKSTTLRLLTVLEMRGYIERSPETERYRLGVRAFEVGSIYVQNMALETEVRPFLEQLSKECNQTANLAILHRGEVVHLAVVPPPRPIRFYAVVGQRERAHLTALGKVLLAYQLSDEDLTRFVAEYGLPRRTPNTITDLQQLRDHLQQVREQGYALDNEESFIGLKCVAAPVYNEMRQVVAAVSISGPAYEFSHDILKQYISSVKRAASDISKCLGNRIWYSMAQIQSNR